MFGLLPVLCATALLFGSSGPAWAEAPVTTSAPPEARESLPWLEEWAVAKKNAQSSKRPLLVLFTGSDWCRWCVKMEKEVFEDPQFIRQTRDQYVFMKVDRPRRKKLPPQIDKVNKELVDKFDIEGYPTVLIMTPDEKVLGEVGYESGGAKAFLRELQSVMQKGKLKGQRS